MRRLKIRDMDLFQYDMTIRQEYKVFCGVDEAGRGPLAGPVCAAAVILPENVYIPGLDDSKKLTEVKREKLYDMITENALSYGIGMVYQDEIDEINILNATYKAMNLAISQLDIPFDIAVIDGNRNVGIECKSMCLVKGDGKSASVAAASVLAKVTRDRYMRDMAEVYPGYMFQQHKGYGTKLHYEKIRELGPCEIHRKTFLKKMH